MLYLEFAIKEFIDLNDASSGRKFRENIFKIQASTSPHEYY